MDLSLHISQKQILSQKMQQSAEILQMNQMELDDFMQEMAVENPVLEWDESSIYTDTAKTLEWLQEPQRGRTPSMTAPQEFSGDFFEKQKEESLEEFLLSQINYLPLEKDEKKIMYFLVESLDDAGYLEPDVLQTVSLLLNTQAQQAEKMLSLFQTLEPSGVGARNLQECLRLQLERRDTPFPLAETIVKNHLELLAKNQLHVIAKKCKVKIVEVTTAKEVIQSLNPKPGSSFSHGEKEEYVLPDVLVTEENGQFSVSLTNSLLPKLTISTYYRDILTTDVSDGAKDYIVKKLKQAQWVMECIRKREETLKSTVETIVSVQETFFTTPHPNANLRSNGTLLPLRLLDVAEVLGVHESTISRTIRGKYLQYRGGVYPLRYFFTTAVATNSQQNLSANTVQNRIRELIAQEDKKTPLSDQKITDFLKTEGVEISRRTVAKYRESMGILGQSGRKQY